MCFGATASRMNSAHSCENRAGCMLPWAAVRRLRAQPHRTLEALTHVSQTPHSRRCSRSRAPSSCRRRWLPPPRLPSCQRLQPGWGWAGIEHWPSAPRRATDTHRLATPRMRARAHCSLACSLTRGGRSLGRLQCSQTRLEDVLVFILVGCRGSALDVSGTPLADARSGGRRQAGGGNGGGRLTATTPPPIDTCIVPHLVPARALAAPVLW